MAALNETRNAKHAVAAGIVSQGLLLKTSASGLVLCAAVGDQPCGISAAESSRNAAGAYEDGTAVDATVAVYPMSGIVYVKAGEAYSAADADFGVPLFLHATDGTVGKTSSGAKQVGTLFQSGEAIAVGDLVAMACIGVGI